MVQMRYFGIVRQQTQCKEEVIEANTLGEMLKYLSQKYGKATEKAACASMLTLNGVKVESLDRNLAIPDGSVVGIHPVCCGG
jgi:molybdopterin converting factor small subunit